MAVDGGDDGGSKRRRHSQTERHDTAEREQLRKRTGDGRESRAGRVQTEPYLEKGLSPEEVAPASEAERQAAEQDRSHQADPLHGRQRRVEFFLDGRKGNADAA